MRYLITVAYDGSKFNGFQRLKNNNSVQGELEKTLSVINKKSVEIKGAGRTDRGVHAYGQKCHFDLDMELAPDKLMNAINSGVNKYIRVKDCTQVRDDFHARFNVIEKEYLYKINMGEYDPMMEDYILQINYKINLNKMKKAAKLFIGTHNFSSFVSVKRENYTATVDKINFVLYGDILYIMIKGKSFFRYMVRNIVGALLEVGKDKKDGQDIKEMLNNDSIEVVLPTAYPQGLYLFNIKY